ncbi:MAG: hypothetical protein A4E55_02427 [Pelotomaculum sp. PtaU1.Bin035]|nr:MAG: hypothetical protein A4E55_02427 [Pelotomaculum sp. PtaU1.Bin035]
MTVFEILSDFIKETPGPWLLTFGAAQIGKTLAEPNYGFMQFLANEAEFFEDNSSVLFSNYNNTCRMNFIVAALVNPRSPGSGQLIFDYYNAFIPIEDSEETGVWFLAVEKFNPLLEYGVAGK